MKKKIFALLLAACVFYCILFPAKMARSAADGLVLWYASVLPTLLPFSIFSNIIIRSNLYDVYFSKIHRLFRFAFPVSPACLYPIAAGFLFGFPLGSKICADLYHSGKIDGKEAEIVSCISNNFGPAFLCNYMLGSSLAGTIPAWAVLTACYAPPILLGRLVLAVTGKKQPCYLQKIPTSRSQINFKIIDAGIMDGFTTMIKLAGYIILFAMLADFIRELPLHSQILRAVCIGSMEITNGIRAAASLNIPPRLICVLDVGFVCFGGISGLFQTSSMLKSTGFRLRNYAFFKLACSLLGMGLTICFWMLLSPAAPV